MQGRVGDPTGATREGIWVDPLRDIAHSLPYVVRAAIEMATKDIANGSDSQYIKDTKTAALGDYAQKLAAFIKMTYGPARPKGATAKAEAMKVNGLLAPHDSAALMNKWFTRAMLGFYFDGVGNALHPGERGLGVDDLLAAVEGLTDDTTEATTNSE